MNYEFEAKNQQGQLLSGTISAKNEAEAEKILWQSKLSVVFLKPKKEHLAILNLIFGRVNVRDKLLFCKQLATMLEAGFPIMQALSVIILQTENRRFREAISGIILDLEQGHTFSSAIAKHPDIFSVVFINAVKTGEASGKLSKVLKQLSSNMDKEYEFYSKLKGSLYYPVFVVVAMLAIGIVMLIKVIPQLEQIFIESGVQLPWTTRLVMWISHFLQDFWWLIILILVGIFLMIRAWGKTPKGKHQLDLAKIKIPIISRLLLLVNMATFCRTFHLLASTGIPILNAIKIVSEVMTNSIYKEALSKVYFQVERGVPLNVPLSQSKCFPAMVSRMIEVGEKTGKLDEMLESLTSFYELETDAEMKKLSSLLEPILIVIIGIGVAIMVFAIIMPIYQLVQVI